ncbi:transmembrane protein 45B [Selaginella moellendorffii]|nr:transmembrane protein 45B [Selaginella moellendorffii]|eukprot:XP_002978614.2 transmembrane protein 45B [Selaginella moellendorffii]
MGWEGMAATGAGFLGIGLWRLVANSTPVDPGKQQHRSIRHCDLQSLFVAFLASLHILGSFLASHRDWRRGYPVASAMALESSGTASMFLVYSLAAILKEKTRILPLPKEILRLLAVTAFGLEFFLFYLKEDDGSGVQGQYHRLLLVPIGVCLVSTLLRICYPRSELLRFIQNLGLILQGTWFFQMASSIFSSRGMSQGCWLDQNGEGDYAVHCKGMMALHRGKAIATLQFNLHLAMILAVVLPTYAFFHKAGGGGDSSQISRYQQLGSSDQPVAGSFQLSETVPGSQIRAQSPTYVLEEEDEA